MLCKTRAIVLHYIKYSESSVIAYCYTKHYGRISLIVQGVRKKNARLKQNLLQPLQVDEIDFYYKEKPGLMRLKELRSCHLADELLFDTRKGAVSLFLAEVLYKTLKEEVKNQEQFDFIEENIKRLNHLEKKYAVFYLKFLLEYSRYLGFYPNTENYRNAAYFDLKNGIFLNAMPNHEFYTKGEILRYLVDLLEIEENKIDTMDIPYRYRDELLNVLLDYYMLHFDSITSFKSLTVLRELFHG